LKIQAIASLTLFHLLSEQAKNKPDHDHVNKAILITGQTNVFLRLYAFQTDEK
jgi:hypothetical protein